VVGAGILLTKIDQFGFLFFFKSRLPRNQELIGIEAFRFQLVQFGFGYDRTNRANLYIPNNKGAKFPPLFWLG
jgi:hypothetical protein